jgi:cyclic di-GMP phosphodiesterase
MDGQPRAGQRPAPDLKQDLSGYPEKIGSRTLNLCTMIVSIAEVFDALRSNRPYRQGLATARIRSIMGEQGNPAFNQVLLKRFVNLIGLFPGIWCGSAATRSRS